MRDPYGAKCKEIRPLLKEIDEDFDIDFDAQKERYYLTHKGGIFRTEAYGDINRELIAEIRHIVWLNKTGRVEDYVDGRNAAMEASNDRAMTRYAEAMASDIRRPLVNNLLYGA